jgi:glycosyltransferase involved in cell wall biosynthesis
LFDVKQSGALWQAIRHLAADPELRARLGQAARAEVIGRERTWAGNARRVADLARNLRR